MRLIDADALKERLNELCPPAPGATVLMSDVFREIGEEETITFPVRVKKMPKTCLDCPYQTFVERSPNSDIADAFCEFTGDRVIYSTRRMRGCPLMLEEGWG